jgi:hypothetical protein
MMMMMMTIVVMMMMMMMMMTTLPLFLHINTTTHYRHSEHYHYRR